jgi:hypothetical protein
MLSLNELSISSVRLLIAVLDVCNNDTIIAEYDVVRNKDSKRINRKTILDDKASGERDVPGIIKKKWLVQNISQQITQRFLIPFDRFFFNLNSLSGFMCYLNQVLKMNTRQKGHVCLPNNMLQCFFPKNYSLDFNVYHMGLKI